MGCTMTNGSERETGAVCAPGVAQLAPQQYRFTLYAPYKHRVAIVASWNNWDGDTDLLEDNGHGYWTIEKRLEDGTHEYQYEVDGVRICDPYAAEIRRPRDPSRPLQETHAVLRVGTPPFSWRHDDWERPPFADLTLYEMHIADFSPEGTFRGATARLDHLHELGATALEIMPVAEVAVADGWGYQPFAFFACRNSFGSPEDLKTLIDEAHARRMAVILDIVLSHSCGDHPFRTLYPEGDSPWHGEGIGGHNLFHMPSFDHRKPAVRQFCADVQAHWLREYHVDGFRYDYAINIGIEGDYGLTEVTRQARRVLPRAYLIAEHLPECPQIMHRVDFDGAWHVKTCYFLRVGILHRDQDEFIWEKFHDLVRYGLDPLAEGWPRATTVVSYIESHDEHRLLHYLLCSELRPPEARRRAQFAAWVLFTAPGLPMLYNGQEFGDCSSKLVNERNPIRWDLLATRGGREMFTFYRRLLQLRRELPALRSDNYVIDQVREHDKCVVYRRWSNWGDQVVVAANFADTPCHMHVALPMAGTWTDEVHEVFCGINEGNTSVNLELQGYEAAVLVHR